MSYFLNQTQYDELKAIFDNAEANGTGYNEVYERISLFIASPDALGNIVAGNV